jgi:hypothetical protein
LAEQTVCRPCNGVGHIGQDRTTGSVRTLLGVSSGVDAGMGKVSGYER